MRLAVRLLSILLLVMLSAPAFAQSALTPEDEKRLGDEAVVALRYLDALTHYQRAYEATKNPALLYNMGRAYEGLNEFPKALDAFEEFAEKASPELKARVPRLDELLADVRKRVATMIISTPVAGAEVRLGNKVLGTTRAGQVIFRVNAGAQTLTVSHKDYFPFERGLALAAGKIETVDLALASRTEEGLLRVTSPVPGAAVTIDGKAMGNVPAETPMKPGQHRVALRRDGYDPAETIVVVTAGERKDIDVPMGVRETITSKWWFWTGIGVVLVGGGIAIYAVATTEKDPTTGTIPPGTVKAESFGFRF